LSLLLPLCAIAGGGLATITGLLVAAAIRTSWSPWTVWILVTGSISVAIGGAAPILMLANRSLQGREFRALDQELDPSQARHAMTPPSSLA
jgi:hypothetical protein